jgi:hypothetical protein
VGVESDDELLYLRLRAQEHQSTSNADDLCSLIKEKLSAQLPEGCELLSVNITRAGRPFQPSSATYLFTVKPEYYNEDLRVRIEQLLASENLKIHRQTDKKSPKVKNVDVRIFLESIKTDGRSIIVECNISSAGSIRIEEILRLLELDEGKLALPIRRTKVKWQINESQLMSSESEHDIINTKNEEKKCQEKCS